MLAGTPHSTRHHQPSIQHRSILVSAVVNKHNCTGHFNICLNYIQQSELHENVFFFLVLIKICHKSWQMIINRKTIFMLFSRWTVVKSIKQTLLWRKKDLYSWLMSIEPICARSEFGLQSASFIYNFTLRLEWSHALLNIFSGSTYCRSSRTITVAFMAIYFTWSLSIASYIDCVLSYDTSHRMCRTTTLFQPPIYFFCQ